MKLIGDKSFLLGLGVGIVISVLMLSSTIPKNLPKYKVEEMAREFGMMYPDEIKAFFNNNNQR